MFLRTRKTNIYQTNIYQNHPAMLYPYISFCKISIQTPPSTNRYFLSLSLHTHTLSSDSSSSLINNLGGGWSSRQMATTSGTLRSIASVALGAIRRSPVKVINCPSCDLVGCIWVVRGRWKILCEGKGSGYSGKNLLFERFIREKAGQLMRLWEKQAAIR